MVTSVAFLLCMWHIKFKECLEFEQNVASWEASLFCIFFHFWWSLLFLWSCTSAYWELLMVYTCRKMLLVQVAFSTSFFLNHYSYLVSHWLLVNYVWHETITGLTTGAIYIYNNWLALNLVPFLYITRLTMPRFKALY